MQTNFATKMMTALLIVSIIAMPSCKSKMEEVHGLIYSNNSGLQVVAEGSVSELVAWQSLDGLCDPVALSPNGQELAYSRTGQDLWWTDLTSGSSTALIGKAIRAEHADIMRVAWSPDGVWLALLVGQIYEGKPVPELVTLFAIESREHRVVELASGVTAFAWLPSGGQIAFVKQFGQGKAGLHLARPSDEEAHLVYEGLLEPSIAVSPRDDLLAVVPRFQSALLTIDLTDVSPVDLLEDYRGLPDLDTSSWLTWSPDGAKIAFVSCATVENESMTCSLTLFVVHIADRLVEEMVSGVRSGPVIWSPDGETIAFERGAEQHIYRISLRDGKVTWWMDADRCGRLFEWR